MENVHPLIFLVPRLRFDCPFPSSLFQHVSVERCKIHRLRLKVLRLERHDLRPAPQTSRLQSMVSQRQAGAQGTLMDVMWCTEWEGNLEENGYMYMYG